MRGFCKDFCQKERCTFLFWQLKPEERKIVSFSDYYFNENVQTFPDTVLFPPRVSILHKSFRMEEMHLLRSVTGHRLHHLKDDVAFRKIQRDSES